MKAGPRGALIGHCAMSALPNGLVTSQTRLVVPREMDSKSRLSRWCSQSPRRQQVSRTTEPNLCANLSVHVPNALDARGKPHTSTPPRGHREESSSTHIPADVTKIGFDAKRTPGCVFVVCYYCCYCALSIQLQPWPRWCDVAALLRFWRRSTTEPPLSSVTATSARGRTRGHPIARVGDPGTAVVYCPPRQNSDVVRTW